MIEKVKEKVYELLDNDKTGHGIDHINRVLNLSLNFAKEEKANKDIITLIALLHDVDDYKLFGIESSENLTNAKRIMSEAKVPNDIQNEVVETLNNFGYSKRLKGLEPKTIEGQIVSDADMCDALGANGILRIYKYSMEKNRPFFDENVFPIEDEKAEGYMKRVANSSVCHMFEKILKLKGLMLTTTGKKEAKKRHQFVVNFLYQFFDEEETEDWKSYLDNYLNSYK